ncbi:AAA family ATPase [Burkholderia cepacia]|uniref:AAA family ATPase n=1 Tax=Burkholderia cepacia TaxID=292 RepID=UPI002FE29031
MDSLRIKNLRSLKDTGHIKFKRINIFVGQNSSGKSSFVRTLPLLKQSAQVKTVSDILWYGPFVDFGSFGEALSRTATEDQIDFVFTMRARFRRNRYRPMSGVRSSSSGILPIGLRLRLKAETDQKKRVMHTQYDLNLFGYNMCLVLDENLKVKKFQCGNLDLTAEAAEEFTFFRHFGLLPGVVIASEFDDAVGVFNKRIAKILEEYVHANKAKEELLKVASELQIGTSDAVLQQLRKVNLGVYWKNRTSEWTNDTPVLQKIATFVLARKFHDIFEAVGDHITETSHFIQYVTPLRATAERYYRSQGLSVDEIDPQGRNLAMFLKNLSEQDANAFADWTAQHMGFEVRAETLQGHVSVVLSDPGKLQRVNLADTGFGYSQVLPILAQLWQVTQGTRFSAVPRYFVIEQPELHLHPRMQARLGDLFVNLANVDKTSKSRMPQFRILIETHSEAIINQLGKAIENGFLSPDDVGIYLFEKDGFEGDTTVRESKFDQEGYLTDWPYGFFDAAV